MSAQLIDPSQPEQLERVQRLLPVGCSGSPVSSLRSCPPLLRVVSSVLCSSGCRSLLTRLSALQASLDRFDIEGVRVVYERLLTQHGTPLNETLWHNTASGQQQWLTRYEQRIRADSRCRQPQQQQERAQPVATPHCAHQSSSVPSVSPPPLSHVGVWAASLGHTASCDVLRDYLIAHTLKDCSLIIDIAATHDRLMALDSQSDSLAVSGWQLECGGELMLGGVYSVQVIDLERKQAHNIPRYAQLDADIANHYIIQRSRR